MSEIIVDEGFEGDRYDERLRWHCRPARWTIGESLLVVFPDPETDFWQRTHYGFCVDNGHFLGLPIEGDFVLSTKVRFFPIHQYDQAGLMVRYSPECWLKTAVEYEPEGDCRLGAVVTQGGYSDWSTQDFPADRNQLALRVRKQGDDLWVEHLEPGTLGGSVQAAIWTQMRLAHISRPRGVIPQVGLYACSPKGAGFRAEFEYLLIEGM